MMLKAKDTKGFTLLEIIVVLLISSIVMIIAGSLIMNSLDFFNKTTSSDVEKYAVDSISSLVHDELMYASDVRITTPDDEILEKGDWRSFNIIDHRLYLDETLVFEDNFYNNRDLKLEVKGYEDGYRINLKFSFMKNASSDVVYTSGSTLELLNLKEQKKINDVFQPFPKTDTYEIGKNDYRLYYKKGDIPDNKTGNIDDSTGTVQDELNCRDEEVSNPGDLSGNFKGEFSQNTTYAYGDFVSFSSNFYRCVEEEGLVTNSVINSPLAMSGWKKIVSSWTNKSAYKTGDVVYYQFKPYKCLRGIDENGDDDKKIMGGVNYDGTPKQPSGEETDTEYWKFLSNQELQEEIDKHLSTNFCEIRDWTVGGEKDRCGNSENIKEWKDYSPPNVETYQLGDFVLYEGKWYRAYVNTDNIHAPSAIGTNNWKLIETAWDNNSRYNVNDIVTYKGNNDTKEKYYRATIGNLTSSAIPGIATEWDGGYATLQEIIKKIKDKELGYEYPTCKYN